MDNLLSILQNKLVTRVIVDDETKDKYVPQVKRTVTYIVSGLILNNNDEVLLMQEAKTTCWGLWYLPAGRMEPNETIEDAVIREVLEETGMICQLDYLISVQMTSHQWFRFNMMCTIQGGKLKTKGDTESLQAKWFSVSDIINEHNIKLRASDIIPVVKEAHYYYKNREKLLRIRPITMGHQKLLMRLVPVFYDPERNEYQVLFSIKPTIHLPTLDIRYGPKHDSFLKAVLGDRDFQLKLILSLEHSGKPKYANDGFCISVLVKIIGLSIPQPADGSSFQWLAVTDQTAREVLSKSLFELEGPPVVF